MDGPLLPRIHWKGEINLGHVMTALTMGASIIWVYSSMQAELKVGQEARAKYIPMIEQTDRLTELQGERIDRLATAMADLRNMTVEMTNSLRSSNENLALEQRSGYNKLLEQVTDVGMQVVKLEATLAARELGLDAQSKNR